MLIMFAFIIIEDPGEDNNSGYTHPSSTEPSGTALDITSPPSITIDNVDSASPLSGNDLSPTLPKSAIELINRVLPGSPEELRDNIPVLPIPDITVTSPSPLPELDFGGDESKKHELTIPDITLTSPSPQPGDDSKQQTTEQIHPYVVTDQQSDDVSSTKPMSEKERLLAELDAMQGPEDATAAESLFDLITGMNPPGEVEEIAPTHGPETPEQPVITLTDEHENDTDENKENLSDDSSRPDICDSPLPSDESPDDIYDSRLEDFLSSGVEELPPSDEGEGVGDGVFRPISGDSDMFRPISGDSEYDSDAYTYQHDADNTFKVTEIVRPEAQKVDKSPELIEPLVSTMLTPLEMCEEERIVPQRHRNRFREMVREQRELAVSEEVSPFELTENGLNQYLENSLVASPVPDSDPHPRPKLADEDEIVPVDKLNVERPTLTSEPELENLVVEQQPAVYSDTEDTNFEQNEAPSVEKPSFTAPSETVSLLETPDESQPPTHEYKSTLPTNDDEITGASTAIAPPIDPGSQSPNLGEENDIDEHMPSQVSIPSEHPSEPEIDGHQRSSKEGSSFSETEQSIGENIEDLPEESATGQPAPSAAIPTDIVEGQDDDKSSLDNAIPPTASTTTELQARSLSKDETTSPTHEYKPELHTGHDDITNASATISPPVDPSQTHNLAEEIDNDDRLPSQKSIPSEHPSEPEIDDHQQGSKESSPFAETEPSDNKNVGDKSTESATGQSAPPAEHPLDIADEPHDGKSNNDIEIPPMSSTTAPKLPESSQSKDQTTQDEEALVDHGPPTSDSGVVTRQPPPLEKNLSTVSVGGPAVDDDSDAFDGDESSEGEENSLSQEAESVWPPVSQKPDLAESNDEVSFCYFSIYASIFMILY